VWGGPPPPYRIETERLVIRCYDPRDAALVKDAIDSSLDHLRPFMAWADDEPQPVEQKVALLRRFRAAFDAGENFTYGIFDAEERQVLGGTGLHPSATRRGIATETSAALTRVAFEVCEADRVEIRIDPRNRASFGIPRRLGFPEEATLRRRLPARDGEPLRDVTIHTLFREDFDPAIAPTLRAYDAAGTQVL
jgi:RimJ/RimL family protein N-acetyltransferase